jgi:DivIVA domain-containing protein
MALERDAIVRRDFPIGRRGYDQSAVDAHLERIADEVDKLRSTPAPAAPAGMADAASQQVRAIVAAAEQSAAGIEQAARADAEATLARADEEARAEVTRVREMVSGLLARLQSVDGELAALEATLGELWASEPEPELEAEPEPEPEPVPAAEAARTPMAAPGPDRPAAANGDLEGARLVALSMALDGTPRDEVERHLAENFDLDDTDSLLDEVFATVEG